MSQRDARAAIEQTLAAYQAPALQAMAAAVGLDRRLTRKNDLIDGLARILAGGEELGQRLTALTDTQWAALAYVARKGAPVPVRSVQRFLRAQGEPDDRADRLLLALLHRGLLLYLTAGVPWKVDFSRHDPTFLSRLVRVPPGVATLVDRPIAWEEAVRAAPEPATVRPGDSGVLLRDLYRLTRALRARPLRLTQAGGPHQSDLRRLVGELRPHVDQKQWHTELDLALFLVELGGAVGLVVAGENGLTAARAAPELLAAPRTAQVARLYPAWQGLGWSELRRVPTLAVDAYGYGDRPEAEQLRAARQIIGEALTALADGTWWDVASLSQAVRRRDPEFLTGSGQPPYGYGSPYAGYYWSGWQHEPKHYRGIRRAGRDYEASLIDRDAGWDEVEGAYLRQVLLEPLSWLGLVDVGLAGDGRLQAVRVTPLGQAVLRGGGESPAPGPAPGPRLVVQPNFEVIVLDAGASLDLLVRLDAFASLRSLDRAAIYHLTRDGVVQALQRGARAGDIERLLTDESGTALPQNVQFSLAEWSLRFERVTLRRSLTLLEADAPAQLDGWLADPRLAPLLGERLSPTVATARVARGDDLRALLGLVGRFDVEDAREPTPGALGLDSSPGRLVAAQEPGRFERQRLEGIADVVGGGTGRVRYQVTAASGARARAAGWTASAVLGLLERRLGRPAPGDLALAIRGWWGEIPPVRQAAVRLVRLPDAVVWPAVEQAGAGGGLVARLASTVALVDEAGLARLSEALAARGIGLEASLPETVMAPLLAAGEAIAAAGDELKPLRGKALRQFLEEAIAEKKRVVMQYQAANQKAPRRYSVAPRLVDRRPSGHWLVAETEPGAQRSFKLDDIFGVGLEEG